MFLAQAQARHDKAMFIKSVIDKHKKHAGQWSRVY
jgi:hypothetical protein